MYWNNLSLSILKVLYKILILYCNRWKSKGNTSIQTFFRALHISLFKVVYERVLNKWIKKNLPCSIWCCLSMQTLQEHFLKGVTATNCTSNLRKTPRRELTKEFNLSKAIYTQQIFTCSEWTIETLEQLWTYFSVFPLFTLNN